MKPGIYPNVAFKDYLAIKAVSNSYLGRLDKCPAAALVEQQDTPAMLLGRAVHKLVLEGLDAFLTEFASLPNGLDRRTKEGKAAYQEIVIANPGKSVLSFDDWQKVTEIFKAVKAHPFASKLLSEHVTEQTIIWQDFETGLLCKARPDCVPNEGKLTLVDLKKTVDASEAAFTRSIIKYGYARQAAMYLDAMNHVRGGLKIDGSGKFDSFVFIAVEEEPPYRTEVYIPDDEFIQYGREQYKGLLMLEKECRTKGVYPHYSGPYTTINKPAWL